jgi:hypothetical protein
LKGEDSGYKSAQNGDDWLHFGYNLGRNGGEKGGGGTSVYFPAKVDLQLSLVLLQFNYPFAAGDD